MVGLFKIQKTIFISLLFLTAAVPSLVTADTYCFEEVGRYYNISPTLLTAISHVESNHNPAAIRHNLNGSIDCGHMQINSCWKKSLSAGWEHLSNPCYCTMVGAWILNGCVERYGYNWNAVACYHAGRSPAELRSKRKQRAVSYIKKVQHAIIGFK